MTKVPWWTVRVDLTRHARERIVERMATTPRKVYKVARKAWVAPLARHKRWFQKSKTFPQGEAHELMGHLFLFVTDNPDYPRLVTMMSNVPQRYFAEIKNQVNEPKT